MFAIAERLVAAGCEEIAFGDTTGMANPAQVRDFFAEAFERLRGVELTAHFHNTRGQGLANALAALEAGVRSFESSFGELGGCPVPKGATGNVATEDLVSMLHEMGHDDRHRPARAAGVRARGPEGARPAAGQPPAERRPGGLAPRVSLRADVEALAAMERRSAGPGERASARVVRRGGCARRARGRCGSSRFATSRASVTSRPCTSRAATLGRLPAAAALASFELDYSGRAQPLRRLLPAGEGANVVARLPARDERRSHARARGPPRRGPHGPDVEPAPGAGRGPARGSRPFSLLPELAMAADRPPARAALRGAGARSSSPGSPHCRLEVARGATVPGASDNATGRGRRARARRAARRRSAASAPR